MRTRGTPAGLASRVTRVSSALLAGAVLVITGCEPDPLVGAPVDGGGGGGGGELTTFTEIRRNLLEPRCATSSCHSGPIEPRLDGPGAYDALVNAASYGSTLRYVAPGEPDASYLVYTLIEDGAAQVGGSTSQQMPPDDPLDDLEIEAIRTWIAAGAQND